jgi:hypothetical protein
MTTEQLTTTTPVDMDVASERGLLIVMLLMVLLGLGGMLLMS